MLFFITFVYSLDDGWVVWNNNQSVLQECTLQNENVSIPKQFVQINRDAFKNSQAKFVDFEEGSQCTIISNSAFSNTKIERIIFPNSIESVGISAFSSSLYLEFVCFQSKLRKIPPSCFQYCSRLKEVYFEEKDLLLNGVLDFTDHETDSVGAQAFDGVNITTVVIPNTWNPWVMDSLFTSSTASKYYIEPKFDYNIFQFIFSKQKS